MTSGHVFFGVSNIAGYVIRHPYTMGMGMYSRPTSRPTPRPIHVDTRVSIICECI